MTCTEANSTQVVTYNQALFQSSTDFITDTVHLSRDPTMLINSVYELESYIEYSPRQTRWSSRPTAESVTQEYWAFYNRICNCIDECTECSVLPGPTYSFFVDGPQTYHYDVRFLTWTADDDGQGVAYERQLIKTCNPLVVELNSISHLKGFFAADESSS
jgi:hypothetical protein